MLRQATAEVHASAETQVDLRADIGSVDGYRRFIHVMHATTTRFARPLDHSSRLAGLEPRSEALIEALGQDLGATGVTECPTPTADYGAAWAVGVGYTLEGSSLGATVLRRRVPPDVSTCYLDLLLSARRTRWVSYSRWLDNPEQSRLAADEIVAGAVAVFVGVHEAIDQVMVLPDLLPT